MKIGKWIKGLLLAIAIFGIGLDICAQAGRDSLDNHYVGLLPRKEPSGIKGIQVNGFYRFFATYTRQYNGYPLSSALGDTLLPRSLFIGDDAQLPNLLLNISGNLKDGSSWGMDVQMFQFLNGSIGTSYGKQVADSLRPNIQFPMGSLRLGGNLGAMLGMTLYGNFKTKWGSWSTSIGGIQWVAISDLTMSSFRGYNRFMLFERNPWDPMGKNITGRYQQYFEQGSIDQDNRWGNRAFQGAVINGTLPGNFSTMLMAGKTEMNGGFVRTPNYTIGGKVKYTGKAGFIAINGIGARNYTDSLAQESFGSNVITTEFFVRLGKHTVKGEVGVGNYFSPLHQLKPGELVQIKYNTPVYFKKLSFEATYYRISPRVVNNAALYWNTTVREYSTNEIPAGSVGSSSLLVPFASSMTRLGQFTNNRTGFNLNFQWEGKNWKWNGGLGSGAEIEKTVGSISVGNPVNQFTRSRFWRWNFPANVGPYNRYSDIYRDVYQTIQLSDDSSGVTLYKKYFNNAELQVKHHRLIGNHDWYVFALFQANSCGREWSPITVTSEKAYVRQYSAEWETYCRLTQRLMINAYYGYERTIGNYLTNINEETFRPMNQFGLGWGYGVDIDLGKNARLYLRNRYFSFEDKSFPLDKFQGSEWTVELKAFF